MNIKLADLLFEEDENKEEVEEKEEVEGIPIEGNVQSLSKSTIEQVSKYVASAINRKMPNKENVPKSAEDNPLGVIQFKDLKLLSNVPIKGLYVSPSQIKGEQQAGLSQTDFKKYEQQQIVPLFLRNDESENIGSNSKGQEMAAIFYLPAMFCDIEDEANKKIHAQLFDLPSIGKDKVYYHTEIKSLKYELVMKDDIENIQNSFKTGNGKILSKVSMKAKRNIPSGANEKKGESETAQANNESYFSNKTIIIKDKNKRATYNMQKLHKNKLSQLLFESDLNELHSQDLKENFVYRSGISRLLNEEMITGDEFYVDETFEGAVKRVEDLLDNDTIIKFQNKEHDFNVYAKKMFDDNLLLLITKNGNLIKATSDFLTFSRDKNSFFQAIYKIVNDNVSESNLDPRDETTDLAKSLITSVFYDGNIDENVKEEFKTLIENNKNDGVIAKVIARANKKEQSGETLKLVSSFIEKSNLEDKQKVNLKTNLNTLNLVSDEKFINFAEQVVSFDKENPGEAFKTITYMSPQSAKALNSLLTSEESVADTLVSSYKDLPREISDTLTPEELQKSFNELDDDKKKKIEQSLIKTPEERQTTSSDEDKDTAEEIVEFRLKGNGDKTFYSIDKLNANGKFRFVMWQRQNKGWKISTDLYYDTLEETKTESADIGVFFDLASDKEKEFIKKNFAKVLNESSKDDNVNFNIIRDFTDWSLRNDIEEAEQNLSYQSNPSEERQPDSSDEEPKVLFRRTSQDQYYSLDNTSIKDGKRNPEYRLTTWSRVYNYDNSESNDNKWRAIKRESLEDCFTLEDAIKSAKVIKDYDFSKPNQANNNDIGKILLNTAFDSEHKMMNQRRLDMHKRIAKFLNITLPPPPPGSQEQEAADDAEQTDQDSGETTQDKKEKDAADSYLDEGNVLYFVNKKSTTLFFEFYKKIKDDQIFNYTLSLDRDFQSAGTRQVKFWDEISKKPYEKGKPSLISKLYPNGSKQGYQIDQLNNVVVTRRIDDYKESIYKTLLLAKQSSEKVLEFSQENQEDIKNFYNKVEDYYNKSASPPPGERDQSQEEEEPESSGDSQENQSTDSGDAGDKDTSSEEQSEEETDLMSKDKWLGNIDPEDWYNTVRDGEYFEFKTDNKNELISLVKIKGKVYYLNGFDVRNINIPDLGNITSLDKNEIIKERLKEFFENNNVYEIKTGEHIFKPSNKPSEKLIDYISGHPVVISISKEFEIIDLQNDGNKRFAKFMKLLDLAASLDDKKDFDENVDKTYPNFKKYFGDFKDAKGLDDLAKKVKSHYENNATGDLSDLTMNNSSGVDTDKDIDRKIVKNFERKVSNFIAKNETLIFSKWTKGGKNGFEPYGHKGSTEKLKELKGDANNQNTFIEKLSQFMLYNFIKKQAMFENRFVFQKGLSLLIENRDDDEHKKNLLDFIKDNQNILVHNLIIGLINHAVNDDIIDTKFKPESDREGKIMSSKVLAKRIKKANGLSDSNEISEDMIRTMLIADLKNICLGIVEKYDPERYEIMLNKVDSIILKDEREESYLSDEEKARKAKTKSRIATAGIVAATGAVAALTGGASLIPSLFAGGKLAAVGAAATKAGIGGAVTSGLGISGAQSLDYKGDKIFDYFKNKIVGKKSDQEIADRLVKREGAEFVITQREDGIYKLLKSEIDELIQLILVLVKEDKGIVEENKNLFIGSLSKFLFEANESGEEISVQDIKDYLKASGILIYNKDSKVTGKDLSVAEKELIGSIAAIFKSHFGVNVKGSEGYKKLDTKRVEVASTVNQNAEKGEAASEQISNMTAGAGIPMGMNAPFNMNQMAAMINMMGGNPMMSFMMMMMNPQFMQQMMQMQKEGVTLGEASKVVAEKTEISDFDKLLEDVIENQRTSLPSISRKDAIKVVKLLKNIYGALNDIEADMTDVAFDPDKKTYTLYKINDIFNIVKEDQEISDNAVSKLVSFIPDQFYNIKLRGKIEQILKNIAIFNEQTKNESFINDIKYNIIYFLANKFTKTLFNKEIKKNSLNDFFEEEVVSYIESYLRVKFTDQNKKDIAECLEEIQKYIDGKIDLSDVSKITAENKLIRNKSIIRRRPIRKNKIINESEFLKSELKRLWKL